MAVSNREFARAVGCSSTMASRVRNGERKPGADLAFRIRRAFKLDHKAHEDAYLAGQHDYGDFLTVHVFNK